MILSRPFGILNLLLFNAPDTSAFVNNGLFKAASFRSFTAGGSSASSLHAVDPDDKYADLLNAYQKKKAPAAPDFSLSTPEPASPSISEIPDMSDVPDVDPSPLAEKSVDILEAIENAANSAIDASNQASEAAASISTPAAATATAAKATAAVKASTTAAAATAVSDSDKAPSLAEYVSKLSSGESPGGKGGLAPDAFKFKSDIASYSSTMKEKIAGSGSGPEPGKAPSLVDFISGKSDYAPSNYVAPDAKEKLLLLKNNLFGKSLDINAAALSEKTKGFGDAASKKLSAVSAGVGLGAGAAQGSAAPSLNLDSIDVSQMVENLHLDEYGAWYVTALTILYAVKQKEDGKLEAKKEFEEELALARARADEAANAAVIAAEGAERAKNLVRSVDIGSIPGEKNIGEKLLEESRVRQLEVANDMMQKDLAELKRENAAQKNMINNIMVKKVEASNTVVAEPVKIEIPVGKSTMDRDPKEDKKILSILKDIDSQNAKKRAALSKPAKKKRATAKKKNIAKKATTVAKAAVPAKKAPAKKRATKKRATKTVAAEASAEAVEVTKASVEVSEVAEASAEFVEASAKEMAADASAQKSIESIEAAEESFNEAITESSKEADLIQEIKGMVANPKDSTASEPPKKKNPTPPKKTSTTSDEIDGNPWGKLKESTLKRKTIAQLSEYLNERQISIDGLSKTELVGTIQSL